MKTNIRNGQQQQLNKRRKIMIRNKRLDKIKKYNLEGGETNSKMKSIRKTEDLNERRKIMMKVKNIKKCNLEENGRVLEDEEIYKGFGQKYFELERLRNGITML